MTEGVRKGEWLELRAGANPGETVAQLPVPAKLLNRLRAEDGFRTQGDRIRLRLFPDEVSEYDPEWKEIDVLYEDDYCLAVLKPPGMPVHPGRPDQTGTLAHAVAMHYAQTGQQCRIRHIHRLDEQTSGPVLYAKNELAHLALDEQMRAKSIRREYVCFVQGRLRDKQGTVDAPIGRDRHRAGRKRVSATGDRAVTHYETLETFAGVSLVKLQLETGRTHQIRVHMSHLGHPLLGDVLYGGSDHLIARQALHGERLSFRHPWTGEPVAVVAPWPDDLLRLLDRLRLSGS